MALFSVCELSATGEVALMGASRDWAVPFVAISLVEGYLDDLVLEGAVAAFGDVLFSKRRAGRIVAAVDVGRGDLTERLSEGHRVLDPK